MKKPKRRVHFPRAKLTAAERKLASKYIAKEVRTGRYPREQAVAIGISRARIAAGKKPRKNRIAGIMERYR